MNHTGGGAIRLQTTPRYDSTLAISQGNFQQILKRHKHGTTLAADGTSTSKLSTPEPEENTVTLGDTVSQKIGIVSLKDYHRNHHNFNDPRSDRESNIEELIINQSDRSRHGGHSALNDEFLDLKN